MYSYFLLSLLETVHCSRHLRERTQHECVDRHWWNRRYWAHVRVNEVSRFIVKRAADVRPDETEGQKGTRNIREGKNETSMAAYWFKLRLHWHCQSLNYQELIALNTGPMAMRNGEVIVRNYRQAVLWPAFYMSRLKIGLFTDTVRNSEPKGNQWPPITLLVVNWLSNQTFTPDLKLLNYTASAPCSTFIISLFHAYITKRNHLGGWNLIIRLARFNGHNLNCIQSSCRRKQKCLVC